MGKRSFIQSEQGSAILLTLFLAAVIMTVGLGFSWLVREHVRTAEALKIKTEAMVQARSAYEMLMYAMLSGKMRNATLQFSPEGSALAGFTHLPLNGTEMSLLGDVVVSVQESNGLVSFTGGKVGVLKRLMPMVTSGTGPEYFLEKYTDWIDPDNLVSINGAERVDYQLESLPFSPRNYPLQYKEELQFIKGMTPEIYNQVAPYLTLLPASGFNPNTASINMLKAYLDIDERTANALQQRIKQAPVITDQELFALSGRKIARRVGIYFFPSPWVEMTIKVGKPESVYVLSAGLDLRETLVAPYSVLYWKEL